MRFSGLAAGRSVNGYEGTRAGATAGLPIAFTLEAVYACMRLFEF